MVSQRFTLRDLCATKFLNYAAGQFLVPECRLADDWSRFFEKETLADCQLVVQGRQFKLVL